MLQVIRYCKGYLSIRVWGYSTERFMNLCSNHNILLWDIENHGEYYTMCISIRGFYQLKSITRKTGTRVAITGRYGLPFLSVRMKKRKIFIVGLLGSFLFWIFMAGFIWNIEIQGNYYVTEDVFRDFLAENGIRPGIKKEALDISELEKAIRNEYDIVTWTSAQIDGTKLIIRMKENDVAIVKNTKEQQMEGGYHLVADKDGTVTGIITRSGIPKVSEGMEVKAGDILVEGIIPIYNEDTTVKRYDYCRADADILLKSLYDVTEQIEEKYEAKVYTGKQRNRRFVMIGDKKLKLPDFLPSYETYDVLEERTQMRLFDNYYLPIYFGKEQVREYVNEERTYTRDEVKVMFEERIQKIMQTLEEKGVQIIEKDVTINKYKGTWNLKVHFTMIEPTGVLREAEPMEAELLPEENEPGE